MKPLDMQRKFKRLNKLFKTNNVCVCSDTQPMHKTMLYSWIPTDSVN